MTSVKIKAKRALRKKQFKKKKKKRAVEETNTGNKMEEDAVQDVSSREVLIWAETIGTMIQDPTPVGEDHSEGLLLACSPYGRRYRGLSSGTESTKGGDCNETSDRSAVCSSDSIRKVRC